MIRKLLVVVATVVAAVAVANVTAVVAEHVSSWLSVGVLAVGLVVLVWWSSRVATRPS